MGTISSPLTQSIKKCILIYVYSIKNQLFKGLNMRKNLLTLDITIAKEIEYILMSENYKPGNKIPSERCFSEMFNVQRQTIRNALKLLIQENIIISVERKGYFVAKPKITKYTNPFSNNAQDIYNLEYTVYQFEKIRPDIKLSDKMLIPQESYVYKIIKLISEENIPVSIETSYIPCDTVRELNIEEIKKHSTENVLKNSSHCEIANSSQKITLVYTNEFESRLLKLDLGTPVMKHKGFVYDKTENLILYFENIMLMNRFAFSRKLSE